jgi:hypothetical protein
MYQKKQVQNTLQKKLSLSVNLNLEFLYVSYHDGFSHYCTFIQLQINKSFHIPNLMHFN